MGELPCAYIDGTSGTQCVLYMARMRGKPSLAKMGSGTLETPVGSIYDRNFYICIPAMLWKAGNDVGKIISLESLVNEQKDCSHFDTTRKIPIMKRYKKVRK